MDYENSIAAMRVHVQNMTEVLDDLEQMQLTDVLELQLCDGSEETFEKSNEYTADDEYMAYELEKQELQSLRLANEQLQRQLAKAKEDIAKVNKDMAKVNEEFAKANEVMNKLKEEAVKEKEREANLKEKIAKANEEIAKLNEKAVKG